MEGHCSHVAMDVILRTQYSVPIEHDIASEAFETFKSHKAAQPLTNGTAVLPIPKWVPRFHSRKTKATARAIRNLIVQLTKARIAQIYARTAP